MSTVEMLKQDSLGWYKVIMDEDTGEILSDPRAITTKPPVTTKPPDKKPFLKEK